jgi:IS6 family transposase
VDSSGATIDFLLSAKRDAAAAERFLAKALGGENHPAPRVINTDKHAAYPPAIAGLQAAGDLADNCQHAPCSTSGNVLEQDHRAIKRRVRARQHFRSFSSGQKTDYLRATPGSAQALCLLRPSIAIPGSKVNLSEKV